MKIGIHIDLGVEPRAKLEKPIIRRSIGNNFEKSGLFSITGQLGLNEPRISLANTMHITISFLYIQFQFTSVRPMLKKKYFAHNFNMFNHFIDLW